MNAKEKRVFIRALCNSVRNGLLENVAKMPADWDGFEIRELIADKFEMERVSAMRKGSRRREYQNTVAISNL